MFGICRACDIFSSDLDSSFYFDRVSVVSQMVDPSDRWFRPDRSHSVDT